MCVFKLTFSYEWFSILGADLINICYDNCKKRNALIVHHVLITIETIFPLEIGGTC